MTLIFLCLIFGDFTYTAAPGTWIDYARTGPLSEHRFLVVEQTGTKGQYHLGAKQKVLDEQGRFLYEIPFADQAWVVRNGILGDENTFLFQNRNDSTIHFWNPKYGEQVLTANGQYPGSGPEQKFLRIANNGSRVVFLSRPIMALNDYGAQEQTRLEVVDLNAVTSQQLFSDQETPVKSYLDAEIKNPKLEFFGQGSSLLLYENLDLDHEYFLVDYTAEMDRTIPIQKKRTSLQHGFMAEFKGILFYYGYKERAELLVLEKIDATEPLIALSEAHKELPGYGAVFELIELISHGKMEWAGNALIGQKNDILIWYDPGQKKLRHYRVQGSTCVGDQSPTSNREIRCDDRTMTVREAPSSWSVVSNLRPQPILEVDISKFK